MAFKILRKNCCGLDVHKAWIFACIRITDANGRTEYKQARFSSFSNGLQDFGWLARKIFLLGCVHGIYRKILDSRVQHPRKDLLVTLAHPKYTKPQEGNKTDHKDAKWICDLYMCGMVKPSLCDTARNSLICWQGKRTAPKTDCLQSRPRPKDVAWMMALKGHDTSSA